MSKIALVVELKMNPGQQDPFVQRVTRHRELCLEREKGCLQFDILVPADGTNSVHLYEVYADQAALDVHVNTPHMAEYRHDTDSMIAERVRVPCKVLVD